ILLGGYNERLLQLPVLYPNLVNSLFEYINEIKPYHVNIRDFTRALEVPVDQANIWTTDFDKPVYYDPLLEDYRVLDPNNSLDRIILQTRPWSDWYNNYLANEAPRRFNITVNFDRVKCVTDSDFVHAIKIIADGKKFQWELIND